MKNKTQKVWRDRTGFPARVNSIALCL